MTGTVLVTYGTTNGSTAQIAETIADVLRKSGLTVEALPAQAVPTVTAYDAVVVGGGLYAGRWQKDARRFLHAAPPRLGRTPAVAVQQRPARRLGLGTGDSARARSEEGHGRARRQGSRHLRGCLEEGAKGWVARMILRNGKGGDFRDFTAIETWAAHVADELTPP